MSTFYGGEPQCKGYVTGVEHCLEAGTRYNRFLCAVECAADGGKHLNICQPHIITLDHRSFEAAQYNCSFRFDALVGAGI
jgi:hypothetical protein